MRLRQNRAIHGRNDRKAIHAGPVLRQNSIPASRTRGGRDRSRTDVRRRLIRASCGGPLKHVDLVAQGQVLELHGGTRTQVQGNVVRKASENYEGRIGHIRSDISRYSGGNRLRTEHWDDTAIWPGTGMTTARGLLSTEIGSGAAFAGYLLCPALSPELCPQKDWRGENLAELAAQSPWLRSHQTAHTTRGLGAGRSRAVSGNVDAPPSPR